MEIIIKLLSLIPIWFMPQITEKIAIYYLLFKGYKFYKNEQLSIYANRRNELVESYLVASSELIVLENMFADSYDSNDLSELENKRFQIKMIINQFSKLFIDEKCIDFLVHKRIKYYKNIKKFTGNDVERLKSILKEINL